MAASIDAGAACVGRTEGPSADTTTARIECRDAATGAVRFDRAFADAGPRASVLVRHATDGDLLVAAPTFGMESRIWRFAPDGSLRSQHDVAGAVFWITARGGFFLRTATFDGYAMLDGEGRTTFLVPGADRERFEYGAGGESVIAYESGDDDWFARLYDANGVLRSQDVLLARSRGQPPEMLVGPNGIFIFEPAGGGLTRIRHVRLDGSLAWERELPSETLDLVRSPLPNGDLALFARNESRVVRRILQGTDGRELSQTDVGCIGCTAVWRVHLGPDDVVRSIHSETGGTSQHRIVRLARTQGLLPANDARRLAGAWYPDYYPGEGLVTTLDPSGDGLFAAWFTTATPFAVGDAGLRWYTLQGVAQAAAPTELTIFENRGGAFGTGPATTPVRVGRATLRIVACDRAELDYVFERSPVVRGRRTLTRLTDPGRSCASAPPTPEGGIDWRQSGAWYDPATAGQGVLTSISPGEIAFGAWFTYDAAGRADDPTQQQWLTLQSTAPVRSGPITLGIHRTVGGVFDRAPAVSSTRIGTATWSATGCSEATLEYRFDADRSAGSLASVSGVQRLIRLGPCPPSSQ